MTSRKLLPLIAIFLAACSQTSEFFSGPAQDPAPSQNTAMQITSSAFKHTQSIPSKFTCDGDNVNPPLEFSDVPEEAASLVLIMDDPDVPKSIREDGMWDHWVVFNIPSTVTQVAEDSQPEGVRGFGTRGTADYSGPCSPDREHRYFFKLYALDSGLSLEEGASKIEVEKAMAGHILAVSQLIGRYGRKK